MQFSIVVLASPTASQGSWSALQFCRTALAGGHDIPRVFFFQDGVGIASRLAQPPADEPSLIEGWQQLAADHDVELVICVSAGSRRGLLDPDEARRRGTEETNVADGFAVSGLGQLAEAVITCDRLMTFGP